MPVTSAAQPATQQTTIKISRYWSAELATGEAGAAAAGSTGGAGCSTGGGGDAMALGLLGGVASAGGAVAGGEEAGGSPVGGIALAPFERSGDGRGGGFSFAPPPIGGGGGMPTRPCSRETASPPICLIPRNESNRDVTRLLKA